MPRLLAAFTEDEADHFGDGLIMFLRDLFVDVHGSVKRAGENRVFDNGDFVVLCDFANFKGQRIHALGRANRRGHGFRLIFERNRVVGRIGDDHVRLRDIRHHSALRRSMRTRRIGALICGSPSLCLCSSLTSCLVIFIF